MTRARPSDQALAVPAGPVARPSPPGFDPSRKDPIWSHIRITDYAPSHRQFRLDENLTEDEITKAVGFEPKRTPDEDKVTLRWQFWAEITYDLPEGRHGSTSTCCKIWNFSGSQWSAYGWPEAFEQLGLTPLFTKDYDTWQFQEDGNPTLPLLRAGIASVIETRSATTAGRGPQDESAAPKVDAKPLVKGETNHD